ncbi:hypothetical protein H4R33_001499 [Dimargaris cristalligena]|uniref:Pre-mRNA-processing factor 17 n=1 Tax=Dimargaris cristalligena TaxID=215637 RepID=A0A4P9ZKU8_9FUNG|nr:hypothetical protein H4R33_001499 [Dimargaris cristalligena]RKP33877.1 WD40-repeat-containing domain protein [Dimargaris cristalligena]|eukprot:RKP33877.1 WD40-repeat-containing domain protein [Dimargaris cristalligena]
MSTSDTPSATKGPRQPEPETKPKPALPAFLKKPAPLPSWITQLTPFKPSAPSGPQATEVAPVLGPHNPHRSQDLADLQLTPNVLTGHVDKEAFSEHSFRIQERNFRRFGEAQDPSLVGNEVVLGSMVKANRPAGENTPAKDRTRAGERARQETIKRQRLNKGDPSVLEGDDAYRGPWAGYQNDRVGQASGPEPAASTEVETPAVTVPSGNEAGKGKRGKGDIRPGEETTTFHGKQERDYQGRTYIHIPTDVDHVKLAGEPGTQKCYIPKTLVHTWTGHTKGVSAIRFFPGSGHLLLSAGMDSKVKIWDVYHDRRCLRTFMGHNKAVRDICFSNDGRRFLTASYDKYLKLWDTETGQCLQSFTTGKMPYCVKFHPDDDKQNVFLAGCADKKIMQFDTNSGEVTQEYDQHLGAVNTITFVDDNRRFISTSDDKTMRAWEFGIPIVIKMIAEPSMHSIPAVTLSPNRKWLAGQSLDNQILIFSAGEKLRPNRKKVFTGHLVAGYACQPNFSPDGRFLMSGDAEGRMWFWDWKSCKTLTKFKAHDNVVIGCEWHPHETSKVATCSWDATIKYWD